MSGSGSDDRAVDDRFGEYRLVRLLGRGGMAETFVAERVLSQGSVLRACLKRILPGLLDDPELARQFRNETEIAATLQHANIAGLLDHGIVDGRHYLALELVDGIDARALLSARARRGDPLEPEFVAEIVFGVAHALDYAHAIGRDGTTLGVVHRDVSPSNVLLGRDGQVKLADFGIAKSTGESHRTRTGLLRGKIPYMPPEYVRGEPFTSAGDLFALGVMLFELLAGRRPFRGSNEAETLDLILHGERPRLEDLRPDVHPAFVDTVDSLLDADPGSRPDCGRDVVRRLAAVAPSATTRLRLADAVTDVATTLAAAHPFAPTVAVTSVAQPRRIAVAGADEATRTRLPR